MAKAVLDQQGVKRCSECNDPPVHGTSFCATHLEKRKQFLAGDKLGMKFSEHKVSFKLLPIPALVEWSETYNYGADKYEEWNWLKGRMFSDYLDSAKRHMLAFEMGEDRDPTSGCHHLAQVMFACAAMMTFQHMNRDDLDDRMKEFINSVYILENSVYNKS